MALGQSKLGKGSDGKERGTHSAPAHHGQPLGPAFEGVTVSEPHLRGNPARDGKPKTFHDVPLHVNALSSAPIADSANPLAPEPLNKKGGLAPHVPGMRSRVNETGPGLPGEHAGRAHAQRGIRAANAQRDTFNILANGHAAVRGKKFR